MKNAVPMKDLVRLKTSERLKRLAKEIRRVAHHAKDEDAIHDLRVCIRRFKQELRVFHGWFEPRHVKRATRGLRHLMDRCAAVRNCDVAKEVIESAGWRHPAVFARLETQRQDARKELERMLKRWRRQDRVKAWRRQLRPMQSGPKEPAAESARRMLPAMLEELFQAGREAAAPGSSHAKMHRFRLQTKQMRYTLELFEPVYPERAGRLMESLKGLQERLGAINDCATTLEMIQENRGATAVVRALANGREAEFRAYARTHLDGPRVKQRWMAVLSAANRTGRR